MASDQVANSFRERYEGKITDHSKNTGKTSIHSGDLSLITVTSSFGRSSMYNRVHLPKFDVLDYSEKNVKKNQRKYLWQLKLHKLGSTKGFGNFQFSDDIFEKLKTLLILEGGESKSIAEKTAFGAGANYKMRVIQEGLKLLELPLSIANHRIFREVFALPLADNFKEFLRGEEDNLFARNVTVNEISESAKERWIIPRAQKMTAFNQWSHENLLNTFKDVLDEKLTNQ